MIISGNTDTLKCVTLNYSDTTVIVEAQNNLMIETSQHGFDSTIESKLIDYPVVIK